MKKYTILLVTLLVSLQLYAQPDYNWVTGAGGTGKDVGDAIYVDEEGSVYVTGEFSGTMIINEDTLISKGNVDYFIAKYDPLGNPLWARRGGGTTSDRGYGVTVDNLGNVVTTGHYISIGTTPADFDTILAFSLGNTDGFIIMYDTNGNMKWFKEIKSVSQIYTKGICTDISNNFYVTGWFGSSSAPTMQIGAETYTSAGQRDIFIVKYDHDGNPIWVKTAGGTNSGDEPEDIAIDNSGNIFVTGGFKDTASFGDLKAYGVAAVDIFVAKYDANGNPLWVKTGLGLGNDKGKSVEVDPEGNVYVTGYFDSSAVFGSTTLTGNDNADIFIAKYSSNGDLLWVKQASSSNVDWGYGIAANSGGCYVTGKFAGTITFGMLDVASMDGEDDSFIAKYDPLGNFEWVKQIGGSGDDCGLAIALDNGGNIYTTGYFKSTTVDFGGTILTTAGAEDIYIAKLGDNPVPVELASFKASVSENSVSLEWITITETNNSAYIIERSTDKANYQSIGTVQGKGTTSEKQSYKFVDGNVSAGKYYYRLKQIDFDGTFSYSNVVNVQINTIKAFALHQNYPNPFNPSTKIKFELPFESTVSLTIYNIIGQEISIPLVNKQYQAGVHEISFNASSLPSGIYIYKLNAKTIDGSIFDQIRKMTLIR